MRGGIDPGTVNIGVAITNDNGKLLYSSILDFKTYGGAIGVTDYIISIFIEQNVKTCAIERFVPFRNTFSKSAEDIIILIGCLWYGLSKNGIETSLFRSIEWKQALNKYLVKELGFSNPSTSFDKKFSCAAAEAITKEKIKNDHQADGIGLSRMWAVQRIQS